jgi:hypothetical protein
VHRALGIADLLTAVLAGEHGMAVPHYDALSRLPTKSSTVATK